MDKTQQRIKIAEACPQLFADNGFIWSNQGYLVHPFNEAIIDPLNDLNAMHEAEKVLTYKQGGEMTVWIKWMTCAGYGPQLFATAEQRAEAFLRTLGLWEDEVNDG